jgi:hypothetical protein
MWHHVFSMSHSCLLYLVYCKLYGVYGMLCCVACCMVYCSLSLSFRMAKLARCPLHAVRCVSQAEFVSGLDAGARAQFDAWSVEAVKVLLLRRDCALTLIPATSAPGLGRICAAAGPHLRRGWGPHHAGPPINVAGAQAQRTQDRGHPEPLSVSAPLKMLR